MKSILIAIATTIFFPGCSKFIDVEPPSDRLVNSTVFANEGSAEAAIIGIYADMMSKDYSYAGGTITWYCGLASDELINYSSSPTQAEFFVNALTATNTEVRELWSQPYSNIYAANAVIENLSRSPGVNESVKKRLIAEAKFIRAFAHFYLTNLFGNVPLILTTDYSTNTKASNSDSATLYNQIINDLTDASLDLPDNYAWNGGERSRPTAMAAQALLARVYLYTQQWSLAQAAASWVIDNPLFELINLNGVFLSNSQESIWQLIPLISNINTAEARFFIIADRPVNTLGGVSLQPALLSAFENGDQRRQNWVDSFSVDGNTFYFPFKYKSLDANVSEYYTVLRLSELLLIRAEANIRLGFIADGITDVNTLRRRARGNQPGDLPDINAVSLNEDSALDVLLHERRAELFTEWGHRWFDLKRTGNVDTILGNVKGENWQPGIDKLFPIPQNQILADPNIHQNPGY